MLQESETSAEREAMSPLPRRQHTVISQRQAPGPALTFLKGRGAQRSGRWLGWDGAGAGPSRPVHPQDPFGDPKAARRSSLRGSSRSPGLPEQWVKQAPQEGHGALSRGLSGVGVQVPNITGEYAF